MTTTNDAPIDKLMDKVADLERQNAKLIRAALIAIEAMENMKQGRFKYASDQLAKALIQ